MRKSHDHTVQEVGENRQALVPEMVRVHRRHPGLNLLNLEATASARLLGARVMLSRPSAGGVLPEVLDAEGIRWDTVGP